VLALALGATVAELQGRMSYAEYCRWVAFYRVEPWGERRADIRAAEAQALQANIHRNPKKRSAPFKNREFLYDWWQAAPAAEKKPVDGQSLLDKFRMLTTAPGGDNG
jgi:hypothetical protein